MCGIDESHVSTGMATHANIGQGSARLVCDATAQNRGLGTAGLLAFGGSLARLFRIGGECNDERNSDKSDDEHGAQGTETIYPALGQHANSPGQ